jgi:two-component system, OmpR family, sensor kinase
MSRPRSPRRIRLTPSPRRIPLTPSLRRIRLTPSLRRIPFRLRLTIGFAGVMVVLFGGLALLLQTQFSTGLDQGIKRSLRTNATDLATLLRGARTLPALPVSSDGGFAQIIDPRTGGVRDATPGHAIRLLSPREVRRAAAGGLLVDRNGARLLAERVATQPPGVLLVAVPLTERNRALTTLSELLFIGGPVLLVLTCLVGYALAARALAPVEKMSARAARISGAQGERLPVPEANDELRRLGEILNAMLSRVEVALARERAFVADAGHELRTPLSILKLELELALESDSSREQLRARLQSVAEEVDRLAKLANDLLVIAHAEQGRLSLDRRRIDVRDVLDAVAARFASPAEAKGRLVRLEDSDGLSVEADRERLEQAITNMVANALTHGEGPVVLRAGQGNGSVQLHVLDEGKGFPPGFLPHAFERFSCADAARSRVGAGLGLSIVQVIAEAHGGRAYVSNRASGGADVWLSLPGSAEN